MLLAGQRPGKDPLAAAYGERFKALIPIGGKSMVCKVTETLLAVPSVRKIVVMAQDPEALLLGDLAPYRSHPRVEFHASGNGIATSIKELAGTGTAPWPVLVTTADHALLSRSMIETFLDGAAGADLSFGVGERAVVEAVYPQTKRTWLKFSDGHYSGANLFAFRNAKVVPALDLWSGIEQDRKKTFKIIGSFGPNLLLRALTRSIGFGDAVHRAGKRLGVIAQPVVLPQAEAVIDVDKPDDVALVEAIIASARQCAENKQG